MKKLTIFLITIYFTTSALQAQNKQEVKNLAAFAKVWGFLKYYHSEVAKGNPDWDKELIRMAPVIESAPDKQVFDKTIADWYAELPKTRLSSSITKIQNDTVMRIFDERDIRNFDVSSILTEELTKVYLYHLPDSNKFTDNRYQQYHLDYIYHKEDPFKDPAYPDEAHRLLALFRYWNIINYFYPHKKLNAPHWDNVLEKFIPLFINAGNADEYREAFLMLTAQIKDSHSFFAQDEWDKAHNRLLTTPFVIYYIKGKFFIGESRYDALMKQEDIKVGDEIVAVNNKPVDEKVNEVKPFVTGTNKLSFYRNIASSLLKTDTSRLIKVTIKRQGRMQEKTVQLYTWSELNQYSKVHPIKLWEDMGNGIWHVRICEIDNPDTLTKLFTDLQQAKTVIWDMRLYPKFKVVQALESGLFAKKIISTVGYTGMLFYPGSFSKDEGVAYYKINTLKLPLYAGKMIVLVNEQTQSLAESVAYELRFRPSTIIMGRQTAGTTGNILFVDYPGGIRASFTAVAVQGLNNSFSEGRGVKIDKELSINAEDLVKYKDFMLRAAYLEAMKRNNETNKKPS